jgi:hypothetical protein
MTLPQAVSVDVVPVTRFLPRPRTRPARPLRSPLVERVARAHALACVVERRRRNFFHLLGALGAVAPRRSRAAGG